MPRDVTLFALIGLTALALGGLPARAGAQSSAIPALPTPKFSGYVQVRESVAPARTAPD